MENKTQNDINPVNFNKKILDIEENIIEINSYLDVVYPYVCSKCTELAFMFEMIKK